MSHSKINNLKKLGNFLNIESNILDELSKNEYNVIESKSVDTDILSNILTIKKICIAKKDGGHRIVYSPTSDNLTNCLKILNTKLRTIYIPNSNVHGYIKGRGIKTNAIEHLGKKYILNIDIDDYFENITKDKVVSSLNSIGFQEEISSIIAHICTHDNKLIQGFHVSPTIANIIFDELDNIFSEYNNIRYTRYADDLYFSSNDEFEIISEVTKQMKKNGFQINEKKTKIMTRGKKQYVTGLTVFDTLQPRISKRKKREIRQIMYYIQKYDYKGYIFHKNGITNDDYLKSEKTKKIVDSKIHQLQQYVKGWLLFINSIEPEFAKNYWHLIK